MTFPHEFLQRYIPGYAHADIYWWLEYNWHWNSIQILKQPQPSLHVYTDASGSKGLGSIFGNTWFSSRCPHRFCLRDIQFKEIYVVLQAIMRWVHLWKGYHVVFHVDNMPVVSALTSGMIQNVQVLNVLRSIVMLAAWLDFSYSSAWFASSQNMLADAASHFEFICSHPLNSVETLSSAPPAMWYEAFPDLSPHIAFFLWHGLTSLTRLTYRTGQKSFTDFFILYPQFRNPDGSILPASQAALLEWVAWLGGVKRLQPKMIKSYITHL